MRSGCVLAAFSMVISLFTVTGCATTGGSSGGWVVVNQPGPAPPPQRSAPPPPQHRKEPERKHDNRGQETAARNHIRSAYRFLQKGQADHALRELEKARPMMGNSFWFHYYAGGAYYLKGMYGKADESWSAAYRYTRDPRLRSRLRTCQSFAVDYLRGEEPAVGLLRSALDMDRDNREARELLEDLTGSRNGAAPQVGFMSSSGKQGKQGEADGNAEPRSKIGPEKGKRGEAGGPAVPRGKMSSEKEKQGGAGSHAMPRDKVDRDKGKPEKKKAVNRKIRDNKRFMGYFLVEMEK